mmetsp:Transcript_21585/g.69696  ORF Transcript_21585/g.69696 Transcript_21585/m.69696 type:complete len:93 (+) Transcript_21585:268-546(+)
MSQCTRDTVIRRLMDLPGYEWQARRRRGQEKYMLPNATLLLRRKLRLKKFTGSPECQQATTAGTCTAVELELAASGCNMPASRALVSSMKKP